MSKKSIVTIVEEQDPYAAQLAPRSASTYSGQIIAKVREALFQRKLKEGDFLGSEKDLAHQFGVSRITARDALRTLEAMGIIDIRVGAGGGARIAAGNPEKFGDALAIQLCLIGADAMEIMDVQMVLEERAAELAALRATPDDIKNIADPLEAAADNMDDPVRFMQLCHQFHLAIAAAAHNRVLEAQLKALHFVLWPNHSRNVNPVIAFKVIRVHQNILKAIEAGDASAAKTIMREHLDRIAQRELADGKLPGDAKAICC